MPHMNYRPAKHGPMRGFNAEIEENPRDRGAGRGRGRGGKKNKVDLRRKY